MASVTTVRPEGSFSDRRSSATPARGAADGPREPFDFCLIVVHDAPLGTEVIEASASRQWRPHAAGGLNRVRKLRAMGGRQHDIGNMPVGRVTIGHCQRNSRMRVDQICRLRATPRGSRRQSLFRRRVRHRSRRDRSQRRIRQREATGLLQRRHHRADLRGVAPQSPRTTAARSSTTPGYPSTARWWRELAHLIEAGLQGAGKISLMLVAICNQRIGSPMRPCT